MHFLADSIARSTQTDIEIVRTVLAEAAHQMRDEHPDAAEAMDQSVAAAAPVDRNASTLPL